MREWVCAPGAPQGLQGPLGRDGALATFGLKLNTRTTPFPGPPNAGVRGRGGRGAGPDTPRSRGLLGRAHESGAIMVLSKYSCRRVLA